MARKYTRDNRGRFASKGGGATARGGRLKTASGNKRQSQTVQAKGGPKGTIGKPKGLKPRALKPKTQISSERQAATDRLKIKTATRRQLRANRESVIPSTPAGPKTMRAQRVGSTLPKSIARTKGNEPAKVAKRVNRKVTSTEKQLARIAEVRRRGLLIDDRTYQRQLKRNLTLKRAQEFTKTGKLPGRDNSIAFKRNIREATTRINEKRAAGAATAKPAAKAEVKLSREARLERAIATATRIAKAKSEKAAAAGAAFAERRRISNRASSKNRSAAFAKEAEAGKQSALALRSSLRAETRASGLRQAKGAAATVKTATSKPAIKPASSKVDLSSGAFVRRAEVAKVRANFAGSAVRGLDRANPKNRRAFAKADALQAASDRYSSIVRKSRGGEFTAAQVFQGMNTRRSTAPKLSKSEKAAATRRANADKRFRENVRKMEADRRRR